VNYGYLSPVVAAVLAARCKVQDYGKKVIEDDIAMNSDCPKNES
jgi:hypothetical protein